MQLNITAVVLVVALSMIVIWGVKESSHVNTVLVMTKIGVLVFFVVIGLTKFNANNLTPLMPHGIDGVFKVGLPGHLYVVCVAHKDGVGL